MAVDVAVPLTVVMTVVVDGTVAVGVAVVL